LVLVVGVYAVVTNISDPITVRVRLVYISNHHAVVFRIYHAVVIVVAVVLKIAT